MGPVSGFGSPGRKSSKLAAAPVREIVGERLPYGERRRSGPGHGGCWPREMNLIPEGR